MRDERGRGRGLAEHGHAGQEGDGGLLGQPPGGEVERVDVDGHPRARDQDVLAVEARVARERDARPVRQHLDVAQLLAQDVAAAGGGAASRDGSRDHQFIRLQLGIRRYAVLAQVRPDRGAHCSRQGAFAQ